MDIEMLPLLHPFSRSPEIFRIAVRKENFLRRHYVWEAADHSVVSQITRSKPSPVWVKL
jgi:hypothetical protein